MNKGPLKAFIFRQRPTPPEVQRGKRAKWFLIRNDDALKPLKYWLGSYKYNTFDEGRDERGNLLVTLINDCDPGNKASTRRKALTKVEIWRPDLVIPTKKAVLQKMTIDNEYVRWWHDNELEELNRHGNG